MSDSTIQEWHKARKSGGQRLHPDTEKNLGFTPPMPWYKKFNWSYVSAALAILAIAYTYRVTNDANPVSIIRDDFSKVTESVQDTIMPEPRVIIKEVPIIKWRTRTVDRPVEVIKYIDNPEAMRKLRELQSRLSSLKALYDYRLQMVTAFYADPPLPGEKKTLTFTSDCPGLDNTIKPARLRQYVQ